jgi:PAS domain S-box-containing protein
MITLPSIDRENHRVEMVRSFGLLNKLPPAQHQEIAALARRLAKTASGLVTLVDSERVWLSGGADDLAPDHCRWSSFCTHTIAQPQQPLWVEDARKDFRFANLPAVLEDPHIRFYAGVPILVNGYAVGTVCVFDAQPRQFDAGLIEDLKSLTKIVAEDLSARHRSQALKGALAASADALIDCDDTGQILSWSEGAERLFGHSMIEAVGRNIDLIIPADMKAAHNRGFEHWRQYGGGRLRRRIELVACRKDGSPVEIELWMSVVHKRGVPEIHSNIRDISERKAQSRALEAARIDAKAASDAKSMFLANMSHELRTPLNGVIGVVDLLTKTALSSHQQELADIIASSSAQLDQLIGDVLDLAKIEAGELVLARDPMHVSDVLKSVTDVLEVRAHEKGLSIETRLTADAAAPVIGDPLRLKQVLTNLVSNAVKFTEAGRVSISVSRAADDYRFEVRDTGIGFNEGQRQAIFGRFQQADGTITRRFGGSGLGLAICRDLVMAMGGDIDCSSRVGEGSTFWFTVPFSPANTSPEVVEEITADVPRAGRVLVVDDNATNRRVAELLLRAIGMEVACVEDGNEAVEAFLSGAFDVILMDMMMPVMDGITATMAIRNIERRDGLERTVIIMLTANILPQHISASLDAGADLHLPKPLSASSLFEALSKVGSFAEQQAVVSRNVA